MRYVATPALKEGTSTLWSCGNCGSTIYATRPTKPTGPCPVCAGSLWVNRRDGVGGFLFDHEPDPQLTLNMTEQQDANREQTR